MPGEVPYQLLLTQFNGSAMAVCGAAILDEHHFLTAAHCNAFGINTMKVFGGSHIKEKIKFLGDVDAIYITNYAYHERMEWAENDIAIGRIKGKFVLSANMQPIKLRTEPAPMGSQCVISGWGVTNYLVHKARTEILQVASVSLVDVEICKKDLRDPVTQDKICASSEEGGACSGDSGGPMVCDGLLTGIIEAGRKDCNGPAIYTDVVYHGDWINSTLTRSKSQAGF